MNNLLAITLSSIVFLVVGYPYTRLLGRITRIEQLGMSYLLGLGASTLFWFISSLLGLKLDLITFTLSSLVAYFVGYILTKFVHKDEGLVRLNKLSKLTKILIAITGFTLLVNLILSACHPITAWDALALYDFRGHTIAISQNLDFIKHASYYVSYPLLTSLFHALVYELGGNNPQALYTLIFTSFLCAVFGRLYLWTNEKAAAITTLILVFAYELFSHATFAYTNLTYTVFFILGILGVISFEKNTKLGSYLVAGLLIGFSTWTRSAEPFWAIMLLLIIWRALRVKNYFGAGLSISLIMAIKYIWTSFHTSVLLALSEPDIAMASLFARSTYVTIWHNLPRLWDYIYLYVFDPYIGLWFLLIPSLLVLYIKKDRILLELILTLLALLALSIFGIMIFSTYYTTWDGIGDSARRMLLFVVPLMIIIGNYALYLTDKKGKK